MAFLGLTIGLTTLPTAFPVNAATTEESGIAPQSEIFPGCTLTQSDWDYYIGETQFVCKTEVPAGVPVLKNYVTINRWSTTGNLSYDYEYGKNFFQNQADDAIFNPQNHNDPDFNMNNHIMTIDSIKYTSKLEDVPNVIVIFEKNQQTIDAFAAKEGIKFIELNIYFCDSSEGNCFSWFPNKNLMAVAIPAEVYRTADWFPEEIPTELYVVSNYSVKEVDRQAPVPNVPANYIINVDDMQSQEQVLSHVIVTDDTDPNPQLIVKSSAYNPANRVVGTYPIVFYVQDAAGNISIDYTLNAVVADVTDPSNPGFGTITQANNVKLSDEEILAKCTVSDNYSSPENIIKMIKKNDYAANWNRVGTYEVVTTASDEAGNLTYSTNYIKVEDKTAPSNVGGNKTVGNSVKLDNVDLMEELCSVSDDTTALEKINLSILSDAYSSNWNIPGTYELVCRATDEAGNYTDSTSYITVTDTTLPTITGKTIDVEYSSPVTDLNSLFSYSDDITSLENLTFKITLDEYSSNANLKGTYQITAEVTDEAGNVSPATSVLRVVDRTKPIITIPTTITVGNSAFHSIDEIKSVAVVEDGYDGVIKEYMITDNDDYQNNYSKLGRYTFTISATDASGNTQSVTITRNVTDDTTPTIKYDMYVIVLSQGETLTQDMIKAFAAQSLGISEAAILSIAGEYDTAELGTYQVKLYMHDGSIRPFAISVGENYNTPAKASFWSADGYSFQALFQFNNWKNWNVAIWATWVGTGVVVIIGIAVIIGFKSKGKGKKLFR